MNTYMCNIVLEDDTQQYKFVGHRKMNKTFLSSLPRHPKAAAPYPPADVYIHLHHHTDRGEDQTTPSWHTEMWTIIKDPVCGWELFGYRFFQANTCNDADVCVDVVPSDTIKHYYGKDFSHLSLTDYSTRPAIRIWMNKDNWCSLPPTTTFRCLSAYRRYLVQHELGHAVVGLHHMGEETCWGEHSKSKNQKTTAPIMLQQTLGTGEDCLPSSCVADTIQRIRRTKTELFG